MPYRPPHYTPVRHQLFAHREASVFTFSEQELVGRALGCALLARAGFPFADVLSRGLSARVVDGLREDVEVLAGMNARRALETALGGELRLETERAGGRSDDGSYDVDSMRMAFGNASISAAFTLAVGAALSGAFQPANDPTRGMVVERDVPNFKALDRIGPIAAGSMKPVPRGGSANMVHLADAAAETQRVRRFGALLALDEQDILDDSIGTFLAVVQDLGRAASALRGDLFFSLLLANAALAADGVALFHSSHANTATTTLDAANLAAAYAAMSNQTVAGRPALVKPRYLLVNPTLFTVAAALVDAFNAALDPEDRLVVRSDPRLGAAGVVDPVTGTQRSGSTTTWFLVADPATSPTIEIGYHGGRQPRVTETTLGAGHWGFAWGVNYDLGACALDFRGLYRGNT